MYYMGEAAVCESCALKPAMHDRLPVLGVTAPTRRSATAHATTGHVKGDAAATIRGGASVCESKISYLRTSALPMRGLRGVQTEISLAAAVYNLKRMGNILGGHRLASALRTATGTVVQSCKNQRAMLRKPKHRSFLNPTIRFVTGCSGRHLLFPGP